MQNLRRLKPPILDANLYDRDLAALPVDLSRLGAATGAALRKPEPAGSVLQRGGAACGDCHDRVAYRTDRSARTRYDLAFPVNTNCLSPALRPP